MNFYTLSYKFAGTLCLSAALAGNTTAQAQTVTKIPSAVLTPFAGKVAVPHISSSTQTPAKAEAVKLPAVEQHHAVAAEQPSPHHPLALQHTVQKPDFLGPFSEKASAQQEHNNTLTEKPLKSQIDVAIQNLLGVKYKLGGNDPSKALDCSALILRIAEVTGQKILPRTAKMIASSTKPVGKDDIRHGDLLFFNTRGDVHSHVGMYLGGGQFVHASSKKGQVTYGHLSNSYFQKRFTGARRIFH